ncbi:Ephrin-B2 [Trichinella pseudospiralis]|uniref:Ephrin-B2 n=1 Tax=Trichinella pseudospiralis TaxID=6337 RepID=A0A0V1FSP1_TRIPS|nr:Ephrin-B2 [Trichinella pseudospiralis]
MPICKWLIVPTGRLLSFTINRVDSAKCSLPFFSQVSGKAQDRRRRNFISPSAGETDLAQGQKFFYLHCSDVKVVSVSPPVTAEICSRFTANSAGLIVYADIRDSVDIHCPKYTDTVTQDKAEHSIIYMVSKFGYDNCILDKERIVGQCSSPYVDSIIKLTLREFTPMPNATSDGSAEGMHERSDGLCSFNNLKMLVHIRRGREDNHRSLKKQTNIHHPQWLLKYRDSLPGSATTNSPGSQMSNDVDNVRQKTLPNQDVANAEQTRRTSRPVDDTVGSYRVDVPLSNRKLEDLVYPNTVLRRQPEAESIILYEIHELSNGELEALGLSSSSKAKLKGSIRCTIVAVVSVLLFAVNWSPVNFINWLSREVL